MANHIPDTELSNLNGKSTEQSMEDSTPSDTNPACEQDNNPDLIQIKESPKAKVLRGQQDKDQRATREDLYTIMEMLFTMINTPNHILTTLTKVREHTVSQKRSPLYHVAKRICFNCRKPGHIACDCRANKAFFNQKQRKMHSQRFNIQQTFNPNLTSSQSNHQISTSQTDTKRDDGHKRRTGKNQCSSSQNNLISP